MASACVQARAPRRADPQEQNTLEVFCNVLSGDRIITLQLTQREVTCADKAANHSKQYHVGPTPRDNTKSQTCMCSPHMSSTTMNAACEQINLDSLAPEMASARALAGPNGSKSLLEASSRSTCWAGPCSCTGKSSTAATGSRHTGHE